jgi:hypothetical protein
MTTPMTPFRTRSPMTRVATVRFRVFPTTTTAMMMMVAAEEEKDRLQRAFASSFAASSFVSMHPT